VTGRVRVKLNGKEAKDTGRLGNFGIFFQFKFKVDEHIVTVQENEEEFYLRVDSYSLRIAQRRIKEERSIFKIQNAGNSTGPKSEKMVCFSSKLSGEKGKENLIAFGFKENQEKPFNIQNQLKNQEKCLLFEKKTLSLIPIEENPKNQDHFESSDTKLQPLGPFNKIIPVQSHKKTSILKTKTTFESKSKEMVQNKPDAPRNTRAKEYNKSMEQDLFKEDSCSQIGASIPENSGFYDHLETPKSLKMNLRESIQPTLKEEPKSFLQNALNEFENGIRKNMPLREETMNKSIAMISANKSMRTPFDDLDEVATENQAPRPKFECIGPKHTDSEEIYQEYRAEARNAEESFEKAISWEGVEEMDSHDAELRDLIC
jgi:hypothetical protein